jgi:hypothetical protein
MGKGFQGVCKPPVSARGWGILQSAIQALRRHRYGARQGKVRELGEAPGMWWWETPPGCVPAPGGSAGVGAHCAVESSQIELPRGWRWGCWQAEPSRTVMSLQRGSGKRVSSTAALDAGDKPWQDRRVFSSSAFYWRWCPGKLRYGQGDSGQPRVLGEGLANATK